jgi:hypothetical protein
MPGFTARQIEYDAGDGMPPTPPEKQNASPSISNQDHDQMHVTRVTIRPALKLGRKLAATRSTNKALRHRFPTFDVMSDPARQQSSKRPRTDDTIADHEPVERGDPWLDDGNVILQAGTTQFRVHRSVLSASSAIFKDMFTLSTPDKPLVEGCPVVHLSDSADDLHHVLKAIYERRYVS